MGYYPPISQFLSTLSLRRATCHHISKNAAIGFLSTLSLRRATRKNLVNGICGVISIHALLAESDQTKALKVSALRISIHALLAESDGIQAQAAILVPPISIHALLAESDSFNAAQPAAQRNFYPRSPCGERPTPLCARIAFGAFLSTLSLRRATCGQQEQGRVAHISIHALLAESDLSRLNAWAAVYYFYPRSPCGERLLALQPRSK